MAPGAKYPLWIRHSGAGLELAGATAGLALAGYWLDGKFDTGPWGLLVGVFIGIVVGLYNLVKASIQAQKDAEQESIDQAGNGEAGKK